MSIVIKDANNTPVVLKTTRDTSTGEEILNVAGGGGGGGGGGTATFENQVTQIQRAETANTLLQNINNKLVASGLPVSIASSTFIFSALNSTSANLAAGATFAGAIENIQNQPSISLIARADQPITITVFEFQDAAGTFQISSTSFSVLANTGFKRSFPLNSNFVRVSVQNTGASPTSSLILDVAYGDIQSSNQNNNLPVSLADINGFTFNGGALPVNQSGVYNSGSITANGQSVVLDLSGNSGASVDIRGTYTGTLQFEATTNGTNWQTVQAVPGGAAVGGTPVTTTTAQGNWTVNVSGYQQLRIVSTAWTSGTANIALRSMLAAGQIYAFLVGTPSFNLGTGGTSATSLGKAEDAVAASGDTGVFILGVRRDALTTSASAAADYNEVAVNRFGAQYVAGFRTSARTYSASAQITAAASATDILAFFGNATTTIQVTKIRITGIQTTTGAVDLQLVRRSTANTGGTSTNFSVALHESTDTANSSTPIAYSANPSALGTAAGIFRRWHQIIGGATSGAGQEYTLEFGENGKPIILSGTTQGIALNLNGVTIAGGVFNVSIEWIEF